MKIKYLILIGLIAIGLFVLPIAIQAEQFGDITCTENWIGGVHKFTCRNPQGGIVKVFQTYTQMNAYYVPPDTEVFIPEVTYVYGAPTQGMQAQP